MTFLFLHKFSFKSKTQLFFFVLTSKILRWSKRKETKKFQFVIFSSLFLLHGGLCLILKPIAEMSQSCQFSLTFFFLIFPLSSVLGGKEEEEEKPFLCLLSLSKLLLKIQLWRQDFLLDFLLHIFKGTIAWLCQTYRTNFALFHCKSKSDLFKYRNDVTFMKLHGKDAQR